MARAHAAPGQADGAGESGASGFASEFASGLASEGTAEPATRAARKVLSVLDRVATNLQTTRYQHRTQVRSREGLYAWDCSGMVTWVLRRAAPRALAAIDRDRPVAVSYFRAIQRAPTRRSRNGWQRLAHIEDARPGDLFAWRRPPNWPRRNTGHVGFLVSEPEPVPEISGAYALRIVDATSLPHQDDTRDPNGEGGFGMGTILVLTDGQGRGLAYGWFGTASRGAIATPIVFGRVTR